MYLCIHCITLNTGVKCIRTHTFLKNAPSFQFDVCDHRFNKNNSSVLYIWYIIPTKI